MGAVMSPPLNSFLLYCKDHRDIVKEANPGKHNSEISSILGKQWRGMSLDEKKKYKDLAKFRRKEYCKTNPFRMLKTPKKSDEFVFSFKIPKKTSLQTH